MVEEEEVYELCYVDTTTGKIVARIAITKTEALLLKRKLRKKETEKGLIVRLIKS